MKKDILFGIIIVLEISSSDNYNDFKKKYYNRSSIPEH